MPFSALGLSPELLRAVAEAQYTTPTPVQAAAIPPILHGKDVRACAQTGSGKTAAYALPMLQRLLGGKVADDRRVSGLIIVPTRELAMQVGESFRSFGRYLPQPIKVERAAAEVENVAFTGEPLAERSGDVVFAALADGAHVQNSGVLENAQVFGRVVLGHVELFGEVVHAEISREQHFYDALPSAIGERLENLGAIKGGHGCGDA